MDCQATGINNSGSFPFGSRTSYGVEGFDAALMHAQVFYDYGSQYQFADYSNPLERMIIDANKNTCTFKGSQTVTITNASATFTAPYDMIIGTIYQGGTILVDTGWIGYIYSCQIYDNGTLIRDYIPMLDSNNIPCLYDKINDKCYYNQGTGSFTYD